MRSLTDHLFIFDLHNTLYDEVLEYSGAINAALDLFMTYLPDTITRAHIINRLSHHHAVLGSDWDNDVWSLLCGDFDIDPALANDLIDRRQKTSQSLTTHYAYQETIQTIKALKEAGATLILATEATANAAADAVRWLTLDGVFDCVYAWPYQKPYSLLQHTKQYFFPEFNDNLYLQKPHAYILASILKDFWAQSGKIDQNCDIHDLFEVKTQNIDDFLSISHGLESNTDPDKLSLLAESLQTTLTPKKYVHPLMDHIYYIGDSIFKDGMMASNANIPFIHAAYGKKQTTDTAVALETLYAVTGWPKSLLQLTQEAGRLPIMNECITPHFTCHHHLDKFIETLSSR